MNKTKTIIGIAGLIGSGKSRFVREASRLVPESSAVATGDILRSTLNAWGIKETRENLVSLSAIMRDTFGHEALSHAVSAAIDRTPSDIVFIDGVRGENVLRILRGYDHSALVYIDSDEESRWQRVRIRPDKPDERNISLDAFRRNESLDQPEHVQMLARVADIVIRNDGNESDFDETIRRTLSSLGLKM